MSDIMENRKKGFEKVFSAIVGSPLEIDYSWMNDSNYRIDPRLSEKKNVYYNLAKSYDSVIAIAWT